VVEGEVFRRREIIQYVANKLGGAHYDERRDERERLLDYAQEAYKVADKKPIYFELLSTGQKLVRSPDIERLRQKLGSQRDL
jgi:hypothetical protein